MQPEVLTENTKKGESAYERVTEALFRRPFMKLGALLLAIVFWAVVIASDPSRTIEKTITGAATVNGTESLRNRGLIVTTDLTSEPVQVKMRAEIRQANYDAATAESFVPRIDLAQQVSTVGRQSVKFSAGSTSMGKVLTFEPESIEIDVEPFTPRKLIPVVVEQTGEEDEPMWVGHPQFDPQRVVLSGPKSVVDQVKRAVVTLDRKDLSTKRPFDSITALFELQDENGRPVSSPFLSVTSDSVAIDSVTVDVDVYPTREIPIAVDTAVVGIPAHGYALSEVRVSPDTVVVAAEQEVLDTLDALNLAFPTDISDASKTVIASTGLLGLSSLRYVSATEVLVEAEIVPAAHVHTYTEIPVSVMGVAPGLEAALSHGAMRCVVRGEYGAVEKLKAESIHLSVDATGLSAGTHTLPVDCLVDGTDAYDIELQYPSVRLTLTGTN